MIKNTFLLVSILLLFSCQKVIDINPGTGEEKVIIEAYLYSDTTAYVIVRKSTGYLSTTYPPAISNAFVTLKDGSGNREPLSWNRGEERYEGVVIKGKIDETYTVTVYLEGKSYSATSTLLYLEPMDSIVVEKEDETIFRYEGYYIKLYGTVSTNIDRYYLFKGYSNGVYLSWPFGINCADNKMISGKLNGFDTGYQCDSLVTAKLQIYALTLPAYKFYQAANVQLNNNGGFFSTPPNNVPSMFSNGAIGVFQCSTVQTLTTYVNVQ